jgi:hypothetical protein
MTFSRRSPLSPREHTTYVLFSMTGRTLNEIVLAEKETSLFPTQMDLVMMAMFCSMERTMQQWKTLFNGVELKIQNIFTPAGAPPGGIEAVKK